MAYSMDDFASEFFGVNNPWASMFSPDEKIHYYDDNLTTKKPRPGYIDAGWVFSETIVMTREDMINMTTYEWNAWAKWVEKSVNIQAREILEDRVYHIFSTRPCITSMAA